MGIQSLAAIRVEELGGRALRVITLADGQTVHKAFPDRDFEEKPT